MTAALVPRVRTPLAFSLVAGTLDRGHVAATGTSLTPAAYAIAAAQLQLEHGAEIVNGEQSLWAVWCNNFGNHDATEEEREDPTVTVFDTVPEHEEAPSGASYQAVHLRRAYPDANAGLAGYWTTLGTRYPEAYAALVAEDPDAFVHGLKLLGYFTADERTYDKIEDALVKGWATRIEGT